MLDVATYAPVAFLAGVVVGLLAASRWRFVRRIEYDRWLVSSTNDPPPLDGDDQS